MIRLGVNIDHVATVRQMRKASKPDPVFAACICEQAGADSIVFHLREDRRHIQERDIYLMKQMVSIPLNMEMSIAPAIVEEAIKLHPNQVTLVPERREELTTEAGLNVIDLFPEIKNVIKRMQDAHISVSLFVDPDMEQVNAAVEVGASIVELHTGRYVDAETSEVREECLQELADAAAGAKSQGLQVAAGHGLDYGNIQPMLSILEIEEFNIGFSIVGRAVIVGLEAAVIQMKDLLL